MFQFTVQKREFDSILLIIKILIVLFFGLQFGEVGAAYLFIAFLTFSLFYSLFGSAIPEQFGRFMMRKRQKEENTNLRSFETRMLIFTLFLGLAGGVLCLFTASFLSLFLKRAEMLVVFRLLALFLPLFCVSGLLKEIILSEYSMLLYRISGFFEVVAFVGFYYLISTKIEAYGLLVEAVLHTQMVSAFYGILAILLAVLFAKMLCIMTLLVLFLRASNHQPAREVMDYRKKEVFAPGKIYLRGIHEVLLRFQFCFMTVLFSGLFLKSAEDNVSAFQAYGRLCGCIMVIVAVILFTVDFATIFLQQKVLSAVAREDRKIARKSISTCIQYLWIFAVMPVFSILVLRDHIVGFIGASFTGTEAFLTQAGFLSIPVLVFAFSTKVWNVLRPLIALCITLVGNLLFGVLCWFQMNKGNMSSVLTLTSCFLILMALLFLMLTIREYGIQSEIIPKMLLASVFAAVLSLLMLGMKILLSPHLGMGITLFLCLAVGFFLYWILLFSFHIVTEQDKKELPLIRIFKKRTFGK